MRKEEEKVSFIHDKTGGGNHLVQKDPKYMPTVDRKNHYYTPKIEEFHVGFEYEELTPQFQGDCETYEKKECGQISLIGVMKSWKYFVDYRVKYLDREDIESLGWVRCSGEYDYTLPATRYQFEIILGIVGDGELEVKISDDNGEYLRFYGIIRSKSELKKVMKQSKIEA
jgi:hypothetical protein